MAEETNIKEKGNDIFKEINDGYLKKKKKRNIILFSIVSAIVLCLSAVIIAFSAIKINTKPSTITEPTTYELKMSTYKPTIDSDSENYEQFYDLYLNSFETSYLTGLFSGSLAGYQIKENINEKFYSSYNTSTRVGTGIHSDLKKHLGENYVHLHYNDEQTLYSSNGEVYKAKANTSQYTVTYYDVYFSLSAENKFDDLTFYLGAYGATGNPFVISITVKANTYALYNFVDSL